MNQNIKKLKKPVKSFHDSVNNYRALSKWNSPEHFEIKKTKK